MRLLFVIIIGIALLSSCNSSGNKQSTYSSNQVKVLEVLQTSSYTYMFVNENDKNFWMAVMKIDAKVGDELYYDEAMEMKDFKSKELDRVFSSILFVQKISNEPISSSMSAVHGQSSQSFSKQDSSSHSGANASKLNEDIQVDPASDGISIAELFINRKDYANKKVVVRGQVVKVNNSIMDQNWVHLQDGTNDSGNFDLTVTTQEFVSVGDIVTLEGTVILDKDFGAGYTYKLIIEGAILK
ncbi:MAG: hypothetical protein HN704_04770 [Bacteroidetes bacterium]|jgi:hypothetical protein|nr:hypothetical protein [Bacteroidota bacterium]MBT6688036.1 hypothetical protein [Bacteroidota bacterium]MBT7145176.1 hypothetical protein [Bacteroidota bacterium]MBT7490904.1 hypothetical protein [Bacteroidota bacterium]